MIEADVLDLARSQVVHGFHDRAVARVLVPLDEDDLLGLVLEDRLHLVGELALRELESVDPELVRRVDGDDRLILRVGLLLAVVRLRQLTATPFCSIGAISIMMMSSTSMTSTSGVTLMSA